MRTGALRYLRFQIGDFLLQKASIPLILAGVVGGMSVWVGSHQARPMDWNSVDGIRIAGQILKQSMDIFLPLLAFLSINSISSADRQHGHVRFFFSKPVPVTGYYLQTWCVYGLLVTLMGGLFTLVMQSFTTPLPVFGAMEAAALTWVLAGGVGYLLSSLTRIDGAVLILIWLVSSVLRTVAAIRPETPLATWLLPLVKLLPPVDRLDAVRTALYGGQAPGSGAVLHIVAYGLCGLVLGVIVLRRRSLIT